MSVSVDYENSQEGGAVAFCQLHQSIQMIIDDMIIFIR